MNSWFLFGVVASLSSLAFANPRAEHFMATVQFAVQESNPTLVPRSQKVVIQEFNNVFDSWPQLHGKHIDVRTQGNEVAFYVSSDIDVREPMERVVSRMIQHLNGRVRGHGRSQFYRTSLVGEPVGGFLEVVVDDTHTKLLAMSAQLVPFRDVLKEIKAKVGSLSYLIPGECADRLVDWSFGDGVEAEPKTVDGALNELASLFNLQLKKEGNSYVFSGNCGNEGTKRYPRAMMPTDILKSTLLPPGQDPHIRQVYMPLMPLGE